MRYVLISIFPEIFTSFFSTSLIAKAQTQGLIETILINPRDFCVDKQQQIDDEPYGGGAGMVIKAQPIIDALKSLQISLSRTKVILVAPSREEFIQQTAHALVDAYDTIVLICGRYEGIDHRVEVWCQHQFGKHFSKISLGKFITLGGEIPALCIIEATARLLPGVIKESISRQDESYRPEFGGESIEYPQYTRPEFVEDIPVPEVLLSGHHAEIENRRKNTRG